MRTEKITKLDGNVYTNQPGISDAWKKSRATQYTLIALRTYEPEERFLDLLRSLPADGWSYIVHDKDVKEDGTPKEPHIHALLHFPREARIRLTTFTKWAQANTLVEVPKDASAYYEYLIHKNAPDKHQYDESERKSESPERLTAKTRVITTQDKMEANAEFISDLFNYRPYDLAVKYGRDYIKNMSKYSEFIRTIETDADRREEQEERIKQAHDLLDTYANALSLRDYLSNAKEKRPNSYRPADVVFRFFDSLEAFQSRTPDLLPSPGVLLLLYSEAMKLYQHRYLAQEDVIRAIDGISSRSEKLATYDEVITNQIKTEREAKFK